MIKLFIDFLKCFGTTQKRSLILVFFGSLFAGILEIFGLALFFPLIKIVQEPDILNEFKISVLFNQYFGITSPQHVVMWIGFLIAVILIIKNLYMIGYNYWQFTFGMKWKNEIAEKIMHKYLFADCTLHLKKASSEILNTLNNKITISINYFVMQMVVMTSYITVFAFIFCFLIYNFFFSTVISGVCLVILVYVQLKLIRKSTQKVNATLSQAIDNNFNVLQQSIGAIKETKMTLKEDYYCQAFKETNAAVTSNDRTIIFLSYLPMYITEMIMILAFIVMCGIILSGNSSGVDVITSLAVIAASVFRIAPTINRALVCYTYMKNSRRVARELIEEYKILDEEALVNETKKEKEVFTGLKKVMKLEGVSFSYDDRKQVILSNINLEIKQGEFIGIAGASGAGKTTLIDILMGLLTVNKGKYTIDGVKVDKNNIRSLRKNIGYVHQDIFIANDTIRKNVAFGLSDEEIDDEKVIKALKTASLYEVFMDKKQGINTKLGENGKNLSGGQKQRVAIARALYNDPAIIVLDEATSSLDVETEHEITRAINALKGNKTIIAIAHRLSTIKDSDKIVLMEEGEIIAIDSYKNLQANNEKFKNLTSLSDVN